jgi:hypothetical protein
MSAHGPKSLFAFSVAGFILVEALSAEKSPQPAILEQQHIEISVKIPPMLLDVSSPAPSGAAVDRGIPPWDAL